MMCCKIKVRVCCVGVTAILVGKRLKYFLKYADAKWHFVGHCPKCYTLALDSSINCDYRETSSIIRNIIR